MARLRRWSRDWLLAGMISAVALATVFPDLGRTGGPMHAGELANAGIFVIFLLHGLALSREGLRAGMLRWKLHAVVQTLTFGFFPLLGLVLGAAFARWVPRPLMLGFLFLCALPSTISSSVAMTAIARGNVAGAIFNATLSNVLGIFATPVLVGLSTHASGQPLALGRAVRDLSMLVLLPLVAGQVLRPLLGAWYQRHGRHANTFDRGVVLLVVYASFCDSVEAGLWTEHGAGVLVLAVGGAGLLLGVVLVAATHLARLAGLRKEDEIAAVFCGSKKSLGAGAAMAKVIFATHPALALVVLPVMIYHQLQLFACSVLANRYARRAVAATAPAGRTA